MIETLLGWQSRVPIPLVLVTTSRIYHFFRPIPRLAIARPPSSSLAHRYPLQQPAAVSPSLADTGAPPPLSGEGEAPDRSLSRWWRRQPRRRTQVSPKSGVGGSSKTTRRDEEKKGKTRQENKTGLKYLRPRLAQLTRKHSIRSAE